MGLLIYIDRYLGTYCLHIGKYSTPLLVWVCRDVPMYVYELHLPGERN